MLTESSSLILLCFWKFRGTSDVWKFKWSFFQFRSLFCHQYYRCHTGRLEIELTYVDEHGFLATSSTPRTSSLSNEFSISLRISLILSTKGFLSIMLVLAYSGGTCEALICQRKNLRWDARYPSVCLYYNLTISFSCTGHSRIPLFLVGRTKNVSRKEK